MSRRRKLAGLAAGVVVAAVAAGLLLGPLRPDDERAPRPLSLRSQDFAENPRWDALNNRRLGPCVTTRQDFGWREAPGGPVLGGLMTRAAGPAWYGQRVALDFERAFSAEGELQVPGTRLEPFPGGSAIIGFFNGANRDWRPPNLVAFQLNADTTTDGGDYWASLAYGSRNYRAGHVPYGDRDRPIGLRFGRTYRWHLAYDPRGAEGRGQLTLSIPEAGDSVSLALSPEARRAGAVLDRFGIANQVIARGEALELRLSRLRLDGHSVGQGPEWIGHGNRIAYRDCLTGQPNSFGWTATGGGRVGGLIGRTDEDRPEMRAYYADRVGRLSLEDRLHAEGTVQLDRANSDSASLIGWFRAGTTGRGEAAAGPPEFLGAAITGPSAIGQYLSPLVASRGGRIRLAEDEAGLVFNPSPRTLRWSLDYYPGSGEGGVMVVRLGSRRAAYSVPAKIRCQGATFTRFGLRNVEKGGSFQVVHFDDLRYTVGTRARGLQRTPPPCPKNGDGPGEERNGDQNGDRRDRDGRDDDTGDRRRKRKNADDR